MLVLDALFDQEIEHEWLGTISAGTVSTEYYWLDKWYNIFRFSEPAGKLRSYYCNVNAPPAFDGRTLSYVDLDVDVMVNADLSYQILDLDDFEQNARTYGYPAEIQDNARGAVVELIRMIQARSFPFDE